MPGEPCQNRFAKPNLSSRLSEEAITDTEYSVLTELTTASGATVAYSDSGLCILTDSRGRSTNGRWRDDSAGNHNFYFENGQKVALTALGTVIEIAPLSGAVETSTLLTPEGVLMKRHGKAVSTKLPNGVFIDEHHQIVDNSGKHSPDSITVDPDGTHNFCLKKGPGKETIYSICEDGTVSIAERLYCKSGLLSEKKTMWTPNTEVHVQTRQLDSEIKIRGAFRRVDDKEIFSGLDGFTAERTPGGTLTIKSGQKTRTLKQGFLRIKSDISGEEIEYQVDNPRRGPRLAYRKEAASFTFGDGTTLSYVTVSGDREKTEHSQCIYLSMPNGQAGRDHFFTKPHNDHVAFVITSLDEPLPEDYEFAFSRKIFDD